MIYRGRRRTTWIRILGPCLLILASFGCDGPSGGTSGSGGRQSPAQEIRDLRGRIHELEKENRALRRRDVLRDEEYLEALDTLGAVLDQLEEVAGGEARVRGMQADYELGDRSARTDYRQQIADQISDLEADLLWSRQELSRARAQIAGMGRERQALVRALAGAEELLEQSEREIARLREENARLLEERDEARERADVLEEEKAQAQERLAEAEREVETMEEGLAGYVFIGDRGRIRDLRRMNVITRTGRTLSPAGAGTSDALRDRYFSRVDPSVREIALGRGLRRAEVRSDHHLQERLYSFKRRGGTLYLVIDDPIAFWGISRYLIVRIYD